MSIAPFLGMYPRQNLPGSSQVCNRFCRTCLVWMDEVRQTCCKHWKIQVCVIGHHPYNPSNILILLASQHLLGQLSWQEELKAKPQVLTGGTIPLDFVAPRSGISEKRRFPEEGGSSSSGKSTNHQTSKTRN